MKGAPLNHQRRKRRRAEGALAEITISRNGTVSVQNVTESVLELVHAIAPDDPSIGKRMRVLEAARRRVRIRRGTIARPNSKRD